MLFVLLNRIENTTFFAQEKRESEGCLLGGATEKTTSAQSETNFQSSLLRRSEREQLVAQADKTVDTCLLPVRIPSDVKIEIFPT